MSSQIRANIESEGALLFIALRDDRSRQGVTLRVPRSMSATLAATLTSAAAPDSLEHYELVLSGEMTITTPKGDPK